MGVLGRSFGDALSFEDALRIYNTFPGVLLPKQLAAVDRDGAWTVALWRASGGAALADVDGQHVRRRALRVCVCVWGGGVCMHGMLATKHVHVCVHKCSCKCTYVYAYLRVLAWLCVVGVRDFAVCMHVLSCMYACARA